MSQTAGNEPQFEHMEPRTETAASACAACQRTIPDVYFEAEGKVFCSGCKDAVLASRSGGSGVVRLLKASLFGTMAAAASAAAWYAIVKLTGYELGIVAVVVGLVVGGAVRIGAEQRGGWVYQTLAVLLTYLAIASSYVPLAVESFRNEMEKEAATVEGEAAAPEAKVDPEGEPLSPEAKEAVLYVSAVILAVVWPVLQVTEGGFIGLLIVGFALYEAWKINRRQAIAFVGPLRLQRGTAASPA